MPAQFSFLIPDHILLDSTGKPSDQSIAAHFGLNRDTRRTFVAKFSHIYKKLLNKDGLSDLLTIYAGQKTRHQTILVSLDSLIDLLSKGKWNELKWVSHMPCLETYALLKYAPDVISSDLLKNKISKKDKSKELIDLYNSLCTSIQVKFFEDLANWNSFEESKRELLSEVLVSLAYSTPSILTTAFETCQQLKKYYSFCLRPNEDTHTDVVNSKDLPNNHSDWISLIQSKLESLESIPGDASARSEFVLTVNQYDEWATKNNNSDTIKYFNTLIEFLLVLAQTYSVTDLLIGDYEVKYRCVWALYLQSLKDCQSNHLVDYLSESESKIQALDESQKDINSSITDIESNINEISSQKSDDQSPIALRKRNKLLTESQRDLANAQLMQQEIEEQKMAAMLPPNSVLDSLDCDGDENNLLFNLTSSVKQALTETSLWIEKKSKFNNIPTPDTHYAYHEDISSLVETETIQQISLHVEQNVIQSSLPVIDKHDTPETVNLEEKNSETISTDSIQNLVDENPANESSIHAAEINRQISKLILRGQIEAASQLSYSLSEHAPDDIIPFLLLKSAYYGMHTFDNRTAFNKYRKVLHQFEAVRSEVTFPESEIHDYLLLVATLQPVLFGGNQSNAVSLLREVPEVIFDTHMKSIVKEAIDFCNRGETLTLQQIRSAGQKTPEPTFNLIKVEHWIQKIKDSRRGYALVLKAQSYLVEHGIFKTIADILIANDKARSSVVDMFVKQYSDFEESNRLLDETIEKIDARVGEGITRIGKQRFYNKVVELVDIAKDWLDGVNRNKSSITDDFCKKFITRITSSIAYFSQIADEEKIALGRRAGARLVSSRMTLLLNVIQGKETPWSENRIDGWFYHPSEIAKLRHGPNDTDWLLWLTELDGAPLANSENATLAIDSGKIRLAHLINLHLQVVDPSIQEIFEKHLRDLLRRIRDLDRKLSEAMLSGYIDSSLGTKFTDTLINLTDLLDHLTLLDDLEPIEQEINTIDLEVVSRLSNKKFELQHRYAEGLAALNKAIPDDPIPSQWSDELKQAFDEDNLSVVDEMLEELDLAVEKQRKITLPKIENPTILRDFVSIQSQLYKNILAADAGYKSIWTQLSEGNAFGLEFKSLSPSLKKAISAICDWQKIKPKNTIDKDLYDQIVMVLEQIGIDAERHYTGAMKEKLAYRTGPGFCLVHIGIDQSVRYSKRPFALFGMGKVRHMPVLIAHHQWEPHEFFEFVEAMNVNSSDALLLISSVPLSPQQRNNFAKLSKQKKRIVLLLDLVTILYLASQEKESSENLTIKNFLWLTIPFTYFNPYEKNTFRPPFPEMRYGRENLITDLARMDGPAIVYGGRQLGKSTLLQDVRLRVDNPQHNIHAFYEMVDKNLYSRGELSKDAHAKAATEIWRFFYRNMKDRRLIPASDSSESPDQMKDAVKQALIANKDASVVGILDEIDPILILDSAQDFSIFRALRDMVANPNVQGRFKVIIGGLENAKRFDKSVNLPLNQMGGSIQVTIMATQEALQLVIEPLRAAGYSFENEAAPKRILAITNRHPGLIQVFCHDLIDFLGANSTSPVGEMVIRVEDIEAVAKIRDVREAIRNRFDMTLALDARYQVIIYSLINERQGSNPFDTQMAKRLAETWLPLAFTQLSNPQFEAFLDEMVGLGVLRKNNDGRFAIRNTNVIRLLADSQFVDIENQLEAAIRDFENTDPLDRHAYHPTKQPSPLTYRDEMALIGRNSADTKNRPGIDPLQYSVTIIVGSDAQGFSDIKETLPGLYEAESIARGSDIKRYKENRFSATDYQDSADFDKKLLTGLLGPRSSEGPQMVFIDVPEQSSLPDILAMLDAAHRVSTPPKHPVRIVFLFYPGFYWKWLESSKFTADREQQQAFIKLGNWKESAIKALLTQLEMSDSIQSVKEVLLKTEGWYFSVKVLVSMKREKEHRAKMELSEFGKKFTPLDKVDRNQAAHILQSTGFNSVNWAKPLLLETGKLFDSVDADSIEIVASDLQINFNPLMIRWLVDLGFLKPLAKTGKSPCYQISPAIKHALQVTQS